MAATLDGEVIPVLARGYSRQEEVRKTNIMVAAVISELLKTMLGPKGMSKMLVTETGEVLVTRNGKAMLERLRVTHPVAKGLIKVARAQGEVAGDGTKTAVVLAGELLKEAGRLLEQGIHPTVIIRGYRVAAGEAVKVLSELAVGVPAEGDEVLRKVAKTIVGSYFSGDIIDHAAELVVAAAKQVAEDESASVNEDEVGFIKKVGGDASDSKLVRGVIIYKEKPHPMMPDRVENARIALLNCMIYPFLRTSDGPRREYVIDERGRLAAFIEGENAISREIARRIRGAGANVVFCRKRISERVMNYLARERVLAFELVSEKDMVRLARATGGKILSNVMDLTEGDLGAAKLAEFRKIAGDEMLFLEGCRNQVTVTLLLRGGVEDAVDELERAIRSGVKAVALTIRRGKILLGGGATEVEVSKRLRRFSRTFGGKEQLAIESFARAIEVVPRMIAANAGMNADDVLAVLRSGGGRLGVDAARRRVVDVYEEGLFDAFDAKRHAILAAYEFASMILRVDDAVAVTKPEEIEKEEEAKARERKRVLDERARKVLEKEEELRKIGKKLSLMG